MRYIMCLIHPLGNVIPLVFHTFRPESVKYNQGVTAASLQSNKELLKLAQDAKSNATDEPVKELRKELLKQI